MTWLICKDISHLCTLTHGFVSLLEHRPEESIEQHWREEEALSLFVTPLVTSLHEELSYNLFLWNFLL